MTAGKTGGSPDTDQKAGLDPIAPGYKQTEIGVIPENWSICRLSDVVQASRHIRYGVVQPGQYDAAGTFMLRSQDYSKGWAGPDGMHRISPALEKQYRNARLAVRDLVMTVVGAGIGQVVVIPAWLDGCIPSRSTARVAIDEEKAALQYVKTFLESSFGKRQIQDCQKEGAQPVVSCPDLGRFLLVKPPLPEQRAIAEALSDVDELLGALDRLITKKRDLKQAAMQQLLTAQTRLPGFHGEWTIKRLGEICDLEMGRTPPRLNPAYWGRGYTWLSISDLQSKVVSSSKEQITEAAAATMKPIPKGTLLMSFKLSIGRLCFAGCDLFTNEAICSFNNLTANADYLYYALSRVDFSLYGKQAVKGYTLNKETLNSVEVTLPPMPAEQTAIAEVLSEMDAELAALEQRREKTRALKQGMMQELLTGRTRLI